MEDGSVSENTAYESILTKEEWVFDLDEPDTS